MLEENSQSNMNSLIEKTLEKDQKMKEDLDFFLIITPIKKNMYVTKTIKPYNSTRIKSRHFLPNISYVGVKKEDLFDRSFVSDVYFLTTKNINLFSFEQKIYDMKNGEMINLFWQQCNDASSYKYICKPENVFTWTRKMSFIHTWQILCKNISKKTKRTLKKLRRNSPKTRKYFSWSIYPSTLRSITL